MANSAVVGILRAMLTADTAQFDSSMRRAAKTQEQFGASVSKTGTQIRALTPQAERMVKSFQGDKLLYQANNITAAVQKLGGAQKLTAAEQTRVNGTLTAAIAKYQALGQTAPKALVDLERATRKAGDGTGFLSTKMVALGAAAGTLAAQLTGQLMRSLVNATRQSFEFAGNLVDLSNQTGLSTTTLQRMDAVAGQTGTTLEALSNAAFKLNVRLSGGGDSVRAAVEELGLSFDKIKQQRIDQQFETIVPALAKVKDEAKRNEIAVELFGQRIARTALTAAKDYEAIAKAAKFSTEEQVQQLDILGDRFDKLGKDLNTFWRNQVASAAFAIDEFKKLGWGDLFKVAITAGPNPSRIAAMLAGGGQAAARAEAERKKAVEDSARATQQATQKQVDYVAALKQAEGELKNLDAAERRQIDAAQKAGIEQEELTELLVRFGVTSKNADIVLKLYNESLRTTSRSTRSLATSQDDLAESTEKSAAAYRAFLNMVGEREKENIQRAQEAAEKAAAEYRTFLNMVGEREKENIQKANEAKEKADAEWRAHQNEMGIRMMEDDARIIEARKQRWLAFRDFLQQSFDHIFHAIGGNLGSLLFGGGDDAAREQAKEAKEHFENLKRSGQASAEELTRAFKAWREAEEKANSAFADKFKSLWSGIKRALTDILDQILGYFVKSFLGGMLKALAATALGQKVGGWLMNALGLGGGVAAAATGAAATAGTAAATGAATAGAAGGAAAGGGLGAVGAFLTNPWTLGIGAALAAAPFIKKGLGWFFDGKPGDFSRRAFRNVTGREPKFHDGGMVPGVGEQWATLLGGESVLNRRATAALGGKSGVDLLNKFYPWANIALRPFVAGVSASAAVPSTAMQRPIGEGGGASSQIIFNVTTPDVEGWNRAFDKEIVPRVKRELLMPRHGLMPLIQQRVLG